MVKINVISGFLGAGKTTLIKKLLTGSLRNEKVVLLENEYGEIGIDGGFMKDAGITVTELNAGCICCTLAGDFQAAVDQLIDTYHPDRILVEPTGVGKLSEILSAVEKAKTRHPDIEIGGSATVVDAGKCRMYMKNFGEFFLDQVKSASTVIFSRTQLLDADRVEKSRLLIAEAHPDARIITTPWDDMEPDFILEVIENGKPLYFAPLEDDDDDDEDEGEHEHHHHHHDHDDDDDEEEEHGHHHHHHHHDHEGGEVEEYGIGTFVYYRRQPFNMARFDEFVARKLPKNVIRVKGICYFKNEYDTCYIFEQAGKQVQLRDAGQWFATMPANELAAFMDREPTLRRDWDDTYGDRMQKLVFIGQHMDKEALTRDLDACLTR
jgi:G3E family GTPase